ncbi:MAG: thymidine kinase [Bacteroidales bacterium]|nr:thymidine kinase [Bacteroidales bacterium]
MYVERNMEAGERSGWIEAIAGSMFSGKTEELIRRLKRAKIAGLPVQIFKPEIDNRYDDIQVVSHDENMIQSTPVHSSSQILLYAEDAKVIGIDEAQFFDQELPNVCNQLAAKGIRVIIAGLDMDFRGKPFGPMPKLLAIAEDVFKTHAICVRCGNLAQYSHRKTSNENVVMLGEIETYEPLCRDCFLKANQQNS